MNPTLTAAAVILSLLALALAVVFLLSRNRRSRPGPEHLPSGDKPSPKASICPLCKTALARGERIHSVIFPGGTEYAVMHIYGCPWCWKDHPRRAPGALKKRNCPSCRSLLSEKDHLFAKVYRKPGKDHVSVTGCTLCR